MQKSLEQIQKENRKFILEATGEYKDELELLKQQAHKIYNGFISTFFYPKPLTLSRVLLALKSKEDPFNPKRYEICLGTKKLFYYDYSKNIELVLDLKKETLEEQTEKTQRGLNTFSND
jgi:hypothetical protein